MATTQQKPKISAHLSYDEAKRSATAERLGIPNEIPDAMLPVLRLTAGMVFEPVREHFGLPVQVLSFYRSQAVNKAVGGSSTSQHMTGEAIDMKATAGFTNARIFELIRRTLVFDQLIWEFGNDQEPDWVHVSYAGNRKNKMQVLRAKKIGGRTVYSPF